MAPSLFLSLPMTCIPAHVIAPPLLLPLEPPSLILPPVSLSSTPLPLLPPACFPRPPPFVLAVAFLCRFFGVVGEAEVVSVSAGPTA